VLELGIGTGRIAIPLAMKGVDVSGIDASPAMLDQLLGRHLDTRIYRHQQPGHNYLQLRHTPTRPAPRTKAQIYRTAQTTTTKCHTGLPIGRFKQARGQPNGSCSIGTTSQSLH